MTDLNKGKQTTNKTNSKRFPQPPFPHQNNLFRVWLEKCNRVPIMAKKYVRYVPEWHT